MASTTLTGWAAIEDLVARADEPLVRAIHGVDLLAAHTMKDRGQDVPPGLLAFQ